MVAAWPPHDAVTFAIIIIIWLRWLLARGPRYDLAAASTGLLGVSNTLDQTLGGAFAHWARAEAALRLLRSVPPRGDRVPGETASP